MESIMKDRVRITDESVANIKAATTADIVPCKGGYMVRMKNKYGAEMLKNGRGEAVYKTKSAAKRVVHRHNAEVEFETPEVLPSPSMRPPESGPDNQSN